LAENKLARPGYRFAREQCMKIRDVMERLSKLNPDMDMNDLRECLTTSRGETDELVEAIDADTDSWDEFSAALTKDAVVPMLLEIRDLLLMPSSEKGWLKPAEMAKKVAEQVGINETKCRERISELEASFGEAAASAESEHRSKVAEMEESQESHLCEARQQHDETIEKLKAAHEARVVSMREDHEYEAERYQERIAEEVRLHGVAEFLMAAEMRAVPGKQAAAVAQVLTDAADRVEAMGQMRLARLVKRRSLFRNKDLDQTMLRVEADGILLSAKRLRRMAAEAEEQGVWPVEFTASEEDTPEVKETLARMLAPVRDEAVAEAADENAIEAEAEDENAIEAEAEAD